MLQRRGEWGHRMMSTWQYFTYIDLSLISFSQLIVFIELVYFIVEPRRFVNLGMIIGELRQSYI